MKKLIALSIALFPLWSLAHVGHGLVQEGPGHYMFAPEHLFPLLVVVTAVVYFIARKKKRHA